MKKWRARRRSLEVGWLLNLKDSKDSKNLEEVFSEQDKGGVGSFQVLKVFVV